MIRLYVDSALSQNQTLPLSESQSHYLIKVMRLENGNEILLFNGIDGEWKGTLSFTKKQAYAELTSQTKPQHPESQLWLLFSPLKPKRTEFLVEKATELGVTCLIPVRCERTSIPKVNLDKMKSHAIEAAEQCGRLSIPDIKPLISLKKILEDWPSSHELVFGDETLTSPSILKTDCKGPHAFLVGPEGGFTSQELDLLRSKGKGVTLSNNILRAETAALVGLSLLALKKDL